MTGLCAIFFLSGCAALLFESLWFRQALLAFGSSVWASSLVLSSFMAGIGLGNAGAARFGRRLRSPVLAFALLELCVGATGIALVLLLPILAPLLVPIFRPVLANDALLQPLRFALSFLLLMIPAIAMGATLPLLVSALGRRREDFGSVLGILYGSNTLGAVVGAVIGEVKLLAILGVAGTGAVAAGLNLLAAAGALLFVRLRPDAATAPAAAAAQRDGGRAGVWGRPALLLAATFLSGGILLALEVVWFRMLVLFIGGTSRAFAVMLSIILAGLALGSFCAGAWMRRQPGVDRHAWSVALAAGALGVLTYWLVAIPLPELGGRFAVLSQVGLSVSAVLMLPVCAASGLLFALLGKSLNDCLDLPVRSAGLLTLCNTVGAALGPLVAGFLLLPRLGMEASLYLLLAGYGAVAALCATRAAVRDARLAWAPALAFGVCMAAFPTGRLADTYLPLVVQHAVWKDAEVVAQREGLTETIHVTRRSFLGEPVSHQLITNGYSMSASGFLGRRYMSLFVHLPVALLPEPRDALLISYGVGNTARALTRVDGMRSIDVVDISREILEASEIIFPDPERNPLRDPRVTVHVEDGRYFLQTTDKTFDLITGEPPPPRLGHVTYLYTQEYFALARDRLRPGGLVSYWLPVDQLSVREAASIAGAFCAVFEDCTLWNGASLNWILLGSRDGVPPPSLASFERQWRDEASKQDLRGIAVETPAALGALFIADATQLRAFTSAAPPVRDAFPLRIQNWLTPPELAPFAQYQEAGACRKRFAGSAWIRRVWPEALRRDTLGQFELTGLLDRSVGVARVSDEVGRLRMLRHALEGSTLETLPLLVIPLDPADVEVARAKQDELPPSLELELTLAHGALARHRWSEAGERYERARALGAEDARIPSLAVYAHCRAGGMERVEALRRELFAPGRASEVSPDLIENRGIDGCWAAAWDPGWRPGS